MHVVPIPLLGGLAMYGGLAAGLLVAGQLSPLRSVFTDSPGWQPACCWPAGSSC